MSDDLARDDDVVSAGPAAGHDEISPAGLRELAAIETNEPLREQIAELVLLRRTRDTPIGTEHKATDAGQIEILVDHPMEIGCLARSGMSERITETAWLPRAPMNATGASSATARRGVAETTAITVRARMKRLVNNANAALVVGFIVGSCLLVYGY